MRTRALLAVSLAVLLLVAAPPAPAQAPILIKLATLVPDGSSWHRILKETAEKWRTVSNGRVKVNIYAGGTLGDDPDVVRKMRLGTLNSAVLTAVGVAEIDKSVYALGVPMMYASYDEVYYVLEKMRPRLEASMESKGFVVLNWADGGWVQFFTRKPVATPDDLRAQKLFTWAGDNDAIEVLKSAGFNPVPLPATEIATALKTGLVTALGTPPQVAVISQFYNDAKNMTDMKWQLLLGATVIKKEAWEKIPADLRPALLEASREAGAQLQAEVRRTADKDVEEMKKRGLNVVAVDAKTRALWEKTAESMYPRIRGPIVPADAFDEAMRYRDEFRKRSATDSQAPIMIKLATLVPDGSSWHLSLKETAEKWRTASNGRVQVRIDAGGTQGDDPDVVRKMRLGTLNAAMLTAVGVAEVDKSVYALGVPMLYASYDEVYYVLEKMRPRLEASMDSKGFVVLNWADGGWAQFFAQKPVATPDDLRAQKLFSWAGDNDAIEIWKSARFNPVPLPATKIATALKTGLVTALGTPPQVAVISQFYNDAKNMTDMKWQLLLGATVIKKEAWEKIPADLRPALLEASREAGAKLQAEVRRTADRDVEEMKKRGLNVVAVDAKNRALWEKTAESMYLRIRGPIVPADAFDEALKYRDEFRKRAGSGGR